MIPIQAIKTMKVSFKQWPKRNLPKHHYSNQFWKNISIPTNIPYLCSFPQNGKIREDRETLTITENKNQSHCLWCLLEFVYTPIATKAQESDKEQPM